MKHTPVISLRKINLLRLNRMRLNRMISPRQFGRNGTQSEMAQVEREVLNQWNLWRGQSQVTGSRCPLVTADCGWLEVVGTEGVAAHCKVGDWTRMRPSSRSALS